MPSEPNFPSIIKSLWFRLSTIAILLLVFWEILDLANGKAQGWTFYLRAREVALEVLVRLIAAALAGVALGTICTAIAAPVLWYFKSRRQWLANTAARAAVVLGVFVASRFTVEVLIKSAHLWSFHKILLAVFYIVFAAVLLIPRMRRELIADAEGLVSDKMTRRTALATVVGAAAVVVTEYAASRTAPLVRAALPTQRPKSNILLITFDALSAKDMSLYGYRLPTTPNIDAFAKKGTVFTRFYSAASFTTPGVATIMTGLYPSEDRIQQLQGHLRAFDRQKTLPHVMRAAGYATGAFFSNPYAYYFAKQSSADFDVLPEPIFVPGGLQRLWKATEPLHQDGAMGSRVEEYRDLEKAWSYVWRTPSNLSHRIRPAASFEQARRILARLPEGFFLWVHVMAPHNPYLPDAIDYGTFLRETEVHVQEEEYFGRWSPHYAPDQQSQVNARRLRYDEFIHTADRAFGGFMKDLEQTGRLSDTTVVVSADHGESFEGGVYQHKSLYLLSPEIHVPLIIRTPGQEDNRTATYTADQTSLAPTILELAELPRPDWMRSPSLVPSLNGGAESGGDGFAFSQYLERNSVFAPLRHGTVSVINGRYQYLVDLENQQGMLRPLDEAQNWNLDRTAENPERATALRAALHARFPDLINSTAPAHPSGDRVSASVSMPN